MPARIPLANNGQVPLHFTADYTARTPQLSAGDTGLGEALQAVGNLAGKVYDQWKADYDEKAEKSLKATQTRFGVERSVERQVQQIRQEQGVKEAEIKKRIEADPRIAEARKEIMQGMQRKEQIQHPERSKSRSRDRGGIDMEP